MTFEELCRDVAGGDPRFTRQRAFGRDGLLVAGKAVLFGEPGGGVVFRVGPEREAGALVVPGASSWTPRAGGRGPRGWVLVPDAAASEWPRLARSALDFVEGA